MYYGSKKEIKDKRDYKLKTKLIKSNKFPEKYELKLSDVKDQGIVNSCVAHSLSTFLEKFNEVNMSAGFIYGYRPLGYNQDEGMYPREALKTLQKVGDVPKENFDHNKEMREIKDLVDSDIVNLKQIASNYKINSYARIYSETDIKKCLLQNTPVPISIPVYNDLDYNRDYIIKKPSGNLQGYHMIIISGYNQFGYIIQNSWGKFWGNKGKAILPYDYPIDSAWAISIKDNNIDTYQTIGQKIIIFFKNIITKLKALFI